jgi:hypothetical protein
VPLIGNLTKTVAAPPPGAMQGEMAVVSGQARVPVELSLLGLQTQGAVGVDIVFLVDHSGSMSPDWPHSDPDGDRFECIRMLAREFMQDRDALDRIAIVLFGGTAPWVVRPEAPWHRWQEVDAAVDDLLDSDPSGGTPMDKGMRQVHALLSSLPSTYRLAILLSDGMPTPDDPDYPQTEIIMTRRVPEARDARILYSTIYLHDPQDSQSPQDNALLAYIARLTDYVSPDPMAEAPRYYFRIADARAAVAAYRALFDVLKNRRVPQDVRLTEVLHPRLRVDAEVPVSFGGPQIDPLANVIGVPLAQAIESFRATQTFSLQLNELNGWAWLRFAVRLDLDSITPAEFEQGFVEIPVNRLPDSRLTWVEPSVGQAGGVAYSATLPQARIRFEFGVRVHKSLSDDGQCVRIELANLAREPLDDFELIECPTGFADLSQADDDFGFDPLGMLYENRVLPWFVQQIPPALRPPPGPARNQLKAKLREAHAPLLTTRPMLGPLLGQFSCSDQPCDVDLDKFWRAREVRGLYRLAQRIEAKGQAYLQLRLADASFLLQGTAPETLYARTDATTRKAGDPQMSVYRARGFAQEKEVLPNPPRMQQVMPGPRPDLCVRTALELAQWKEFGALFRGTAFSSSSIDPRSLLGSPDIEPYWRGAGAQVGVRVRVLNGGQDVPAGRHVQVRAIYLPITGDDWAAPPYKPMAPLVGHRTMSLPAVPYCDDPDVQGLWVSVPFQGLKVATAAGPGAQATAAQLAKVKKALVFVAVEVDLAAGERMSVNNRAIEVAPLACT